MEKKRKERLAEIGLFIVTLIWGTSFVIVKDTTATVPPGFLVALRFTIAAIAMAVIFRKRLKALNRATVKAGLLVGVFLFVAYYLQTVAILFTTAGKNAFLTATYVVLVPFLYWGVKKVRPRPQNLIAAALCISGIALISLGGDGFSLNLGDALTLLCGLAFAFHIVFLSIVTKDHDPILLTILQFATVGVLSFACAVPTETFPAFTWSSALPVLYLAVFGTMVALGLQAVSQKYVEASKASLIMSLESFIGCVSGIVFLGEPVTPRLIGGFCLIFAAMMVSELRGLPFRKKKTEA